MLLSELEERGRRFKLALRAGVPILLLIALVTYAVLLKGRSLSFSIENSILLGGIVFISIYFIYFLLEQDAQETLLDHETHGFNHKAFARKLESSQPKTLALLIISNLSLINENYGTEETNKLLFHVIQRLNQSLKEDGFEHAVIGRRYGAEFLIAIQGKRGDLKSALEHFASDNHTINGIDVAYKFALMTYSNEPLDKTVAHLKDELTECDACNFDSKKQPDELQDFSKISTLETAVVEAITQKQLQFFFRPLYNLKKGEVDIYEVSVKLHSESFGDILPRVFLPIVNRLGLGREYDFAIIEHLVSLLPLIDDHISFTFNISPFSLRNREFQSKLFAFLDHANVNNARLIIELYERKAHHDLSHYFQTLSYMRTKGLRIAIDNFGSSNASMEYMKHFHFDMVQFDRDYVTKLEDPITYEMLRSLIKMSQNLRIQTIAKWVDKEEQKQKLRTLGIDYIQGYGVGKPISESQMITQYNPKEQA